MTKKNLTLMSDPSAVEILPSADKPSVFIGIHREWLDLNKREGSNARPAITLITTPDKIDETVHAVIGKKDGVEVFRVETDCVNPWPLEGGLRAYVKVAAGVEIEIVNEPKK